MEIGSTFSHAFAIVKNNIAAMLVGGLVSVVAYLACSFIPAAVFGDVRFETPSSAGALSSGSSLASSLLGLALQMLLFTPLAAGLVAIAVRYSATGRTAEVGEAFSGYGRFGALLVFQLIAIVAYLIATIVVFVISLFGGIVLAMIPGGILLLIPVVLAPYIYIVVNWVYVVPILFDKEGGVLEAIAESRRQVRRNGFWPTLIVLFLVGLAGLVATLVTLGLGSIVVMPWTAAAIVAMYMQATDRKGQLQAAIAGLTPEQPMVHHPWAGEAAPGMGAVPSLGPGILPPMGPRSYDPRAAGPDPRAASPGPGAASVPAPDGAPPPRPERPVPAQSWDQMPDAGGAAGGQTPAATPTPEPMATPEPPTPPTPPDPA